MDPIVAQSKTIALLVSLSTPKKKIADQLGVSVFQLNRAMASPEYSQALKEISDEASSKAIDQIKLRLETLTIKALNVIEECLNAGDLDAAKEVFKLTGITKEEGKAQADTNINVILPGQRVEKVIEVKKDGSES